MNTFYLYPGKLAAFKDETLISTLLGSCVAVALWDPTHKVGGLNHYLLSEELSAQSESHRYGQYAIPALVEECLRLGAELKNLQAKIYGGGNVITMSHIGEGIGSRNIEYAEKTLAQYGIPIVARDVAGKSARTLKFNTRTGEVVHLLTKGSDSSTPVDISGFKPLAVEKSIRVLVVDDSATVRTLFGKIFEKAGFEVVGMAADAYQARDLIVSAKPNVITLDIEMPKMSGVMFLEKIMKHLPIPVVMVSSLSSSGEAALRSIELGAIEFVHKPSQFDPAVIRTLAESLIEKVRAAASVNVVKSLRQAPGSSSPTSISSVKNSSSQIANSQITNRLKKATELKVVVAGGNAGSADSIEEFVKNLAADTPPVVVACSTIAGFLSSYTNKIKKDAKVIPVIGKDGDLLRMGHVYFIPANTHAQLEASNLGPMLRFSKSLPVKSIQQPSSDILFSSAAVSYGRGIFAILFSGFGSDGVQGLADIQDKGGFTLVQNPDEAQFPFAPQKAIELGVVDEIQGSKDIADVLMNYRNKNLY